MRNLPDTPCFKQCDDIAFLHGRYLDEADSVCIAGLAYDVGHLEPGCRRFDWLPRSRACCILVDASGEEEMGGVGQYPVHVNGRVCCFTFVTDVR